MIERFRRWLRLWLHFDEYRQVVNDLHALENRLFLLENELHAKEYQAGKVNPCEPRKLIVTTSMSQFRQLCPEEEIYVP